MQSQCQDLSDRIKLGNTRHPSFLQWLVPEANGDLHKKLFFDHWRRVTLEENWFQNSIPCQVIRYLFFPVYLPFLYLAFGGRSGCAFDGGLWSFCVEMR